MAWIRIFLGLVIAVIFAVSVSAEDHSNDSIVVRIQELDYSNHPIVVRMQQLDNLLRRNANGSRNDDILNFIRDEIVRNTPKHNRLPNHGESIVAMLKLLATLGKKFVHHLESDRRFYPSFWKSYTMTMIQLSSDPASAIQAERSLAEHILDWNTCLELFEILGIYDRWDARVEWVSFIALNVIENTSHLKNTFTKGMMLKLNIMRNQANSINAIRMFNDGNNELVIRFPFKRIIFDLELFDRNGSSGQLIESQMTKTLIDETTSHSASMRFNNTRRTYQECGIAIAHLPLLELKTSELTNHIDAVAYAMELTEYSINNWRSVSKLHSMLKTKLTPLVILNNGLSERLEQFAHVRASMKKKNSENIFMQGIERPTPQFMDLLTIATKFGQNSRIVQQTFFSVSHFIQNSIAKMPITESTEELAEYDRYHGALYVENEHIFKRKYKNDRIHYISIINQDPLSKLSVKFLMSAVNQSPQNASIIRHKVRILLRLALHYANCSPQIRNKIPSIARKFKRIGLLYFKLMKDGADIFTTDSALISVWYQFTVNFPEIISSILDSNALRIISNSSSYAKNPSENADADAILYIFLARAANRLAAIGRRWDAYGLSLRVAQLERKIGYADNSAQFIQDHVLREKQLFYILFANHIGRFELTGVVRHHVELYTAMTNWQWKEMRLNFNVEMLAKRQLLDAIFISALDDPDVTNKLDDPTGQLGPRVNKLTSRYVRDYYWNDSTLTDRARICQPIFGEFLLQ